WRKAGRGCLCLCGTTSYDSQKPQHSKQQTKTHNHRTLKVGRRGGEHDLTLPGYLRASFT
ncbi:MAG TPA: hypothetical protein VKQ72_02750, partial [Aggregatilineales bacterium]|nr:hypothetical protein [Aggregatilineales bacterium]